MPLPGSRPITPAMRETGLHLLAGALLAGAIAIPMVLVWYPAPLFEAAGTGRLPVFLACVATALGPFVFTSRRAVTGGIQVFVLAGCALALYVQRPVYLVFTVDRFDLVIAMDLDPRDLAKADRAEFQHRPLRGPRYVAALQPADPAEVQRILMGALQGGKDLQAFPRYYVPYAQEARNALKRAKPLGTVRAKDPEAVESYLRATGRSEGSVGFLPLRARKKDGIVLLDAVSGDPLEILLIDPW
jgi:hypothetical protein